MWRSMTGYGRGQAQAGEVAVSAEVRSVNHRFLDLHVRCPAKYLAWEGRVRSLVRESVRRGKVDVFVAVKEWGRVGTRVRVNRPLLASFLAEVGTVREEFGLGMDLTFRDLVGVPDLFVFSPEGGEDPTEENWALAEEALRKALEMLGAERAREGERLRQAIRGSLATLRGLSEEISSLSSENKVLAVERFKERILLAQSEAGADPARLHQEAAYLLDRLDVTEECDRLSSHLDGLERLLASPGEAVGKRFDFLLQEAFRELSTASTKSAHAGISERAVSAKTEVEKIREQIQNVE